MSEINYDEEEKLITEFDWNSYYWHSETQEAREQDQYRNWYESDKEPSVEEHTFRVEATWTMIATVPMKAKTLEEAMEKVRCMDGLPSNGHYLDDSFQVDEDTTKDLYFAGRWERALEAKSGDDS